MTEQRTLEVLCATMGQDDFQKIEEMNICSDVLFANQTNKTYYKLKEYTVKSPFLARMISTETIGVSNNRNILLTYALGDICLFADDDVRYYDGYDKIILNAFEELPDADMIIFNLDTDSRERSIYQIKKKRKYYRFEKNPYGCVRIAFKLSKQKLYNIWFNNLLGPGSMYSFGEDSLFIERFREKGNVYLYPQSIGFVSFDKSSWFNGYNEKYYYDKGAWLQISKKKVAYVWMIYYALMLCKMSVKKFVFGFKWMWDGYQNSKRLIPYDSIKKDGTL